MNIGIDIDDVIMDTLPCVNNFYNKKNKTSHKLEDYSSYNWWSLWGISKEESMSIWSELNFSGESDKINPLENASESINHLLKKHKLTFITARNKEIKEITERWFLKNLSLNSPNIIFCSNFYTSNHSISKLDVCKSSNIKIMVEDNENYSLELADAGIIVILFNKPWNKSANHKNIIRVSGWLEALEKIENLEKTNNY